jgi:Ca-activated chloride channel family protein
MVFENLYFIYLLWLTPLLIIFLVYAYKRRIHLLELFCNNQICQKVIEGYSHKRRKVKFSLIVIVFILLIFSLAGPKWGYVWEDIHRKGVDIFVAIDVSDSMLAEDIDPNRLERAKRELIDFMDFLQGDRVGIIVFAGTSFIQCPLTLDYSALQMFIDQISTSSVPVKGTSLGSAIQTAIDAFNRSAESSSKAIILITDGEDHAGNVLNIAKEAKKQDIRIYAIGLGKPGGGTIPAYRGTKKDFSGNVVVSTPNFDQLKEIAKITGGVYANSVTGNMDIENIYLKGIKQALQERDLKTTREKKWIHRFQWPLAIALFMLLAEFFLSERKRIEKNKISQKVKE